MNDIVVFSMEYNDLPYLLYGKVDITVINYGGENYYCLSDIYCHDLVLKSEEFEVKNVTTALKRICINLRKEKKKGVKVFKLSNTLYNFCTLEGLLEISRNTKKYRSLIEDICEKIKYGEKVVNERRKNLEERYPDKEILFTDDEDELLEKLNANLEVQKIVCGVIKARNYYSSSCVNIEASWDRLPEPLKEGVNEKIKSRNRGVYYTINNFEEAILAKKEAEETLKSVEGLISFCDSIEGYTSYHHVDFIRPNSYNKELLKYCEKELATKKDFIIKDGVVYVSEKNIEKKLGSFNFAVCANNNAAKYKGTGLSFVSEEAEIFYSTLSLTRYCNSTTLLKNKQVISSLIEDMKKYKKFHKGLNVCKNLDIDKMNVMFATLKVIRAMDKASKEFSGVVVGSISDEEIKRLMKDCHPVFIEFANKKIKSFSEDFCLDNIGIENISEHEKILKNLRFYRSSLIYLGAAYKSALEDQEGRAHGFMENFNISENFKVLIPSLVRDLIKKRSLNRAPIYRTETASSGELVSCGTGTLVVD